LCVFWYHSPNILDTLHICNISWLRVNLNTHFHPVPFSRTTYAQTQSYFFLMSSVLRSISSYIYIFPVSRVFWMYFVDDFNVSYLQQNFFLGTFHDSRNAVKLSYKKAHLRLQYFFSVHKSDLKIFLLLEAILL
jgi:hypothetical protein